MTDTLIDLGTSSHHRINKRTWYEDLHGWRTVYVNYCPFWNCAVDDQAGLRLCLAMLASNDIASVRDIGKAFDVSHAFVHKLAARLKKEGLDGIHPDKSGPRGPMKMSAEVRRFALRLIHEGQSVRKVAAATGERFGITISHNTIAILKRKTLRPEPPVVAQPAQKLLPGGGASAIIVPADLNGVETQYGGAFLYFAALAQLQVVSIWVSGDPGQGSLEHAGTGNRDPAAEDREENPGGHPEDAGLPGRRPDGAALGKALR